MKTACGFLPNAHDVVLHRKMNEKDEDVKMTKTDAYLKARYMAAIDDEFEKACRHYPKFASEHEGWAIVAEELDELWDAVKLKQADPTRYAKCEKEAIQVAAMALRFLHDLHDFKKGKG